MVEKEYRNISSLKLWDKNPREINKKDFKRLCKQIKELGQYKPLIVTTDNEVIGGNMRMRAYQELGIKDVWVSVVNPKDEAEKIKIALSDNDRAGYYNDDMLGELCYDFADKINFEDFSIDLKEPFNLKDFMSNYAPETEKDDEVPELPKEPISKLGDLYILGEHRLICGDSTDKKYYEILMGDNRADMVFTDPPYGVDYGKKNRMLNSFQKAGRNLKDIANDMLKGDKLFEFLVKVFTLNYEHGADHCSYYVTAPQGGELGLMMMMMMMSGLPVKHVLIWAKNSPSFSLGRLDYEYQHEPILYTWKKTHKFYGQGTRRSIWEIPKPRKCDIHPTMKPVELIENALRNSTQENNIVLDVFGGSGSTLIACEKLNRKCRMIELDPAYCDVIVTRWEEFTGKKAIKQ